MKDIVIDRQTIMNYIVFNDCSYSKAKLEDYSLTDLVIIKTEIELKKRKVISNQK